VDIVFLTFLVGVGVVTLLAVALLTSVRLRYASSHRRGLTTRGQEEPSAYVSAVFTGTSRLPVIEGVARRKRRVVWTTETALVLAGCALAVVVAFLTVHYVG
jgi:hypothetical protein